MTAPLATTPGLVLRHLTRADVAPLFEGFGDAACMQWWSRGPFATEAELAEYLLPESPDGARIMVAAGRADDVPRLYCGIFPRARGQVEIGYMCRPSVQGQGIATEAIGAVLDMAFADPSIRRVYADTDPDNTASNRLLARLGFTLEGRLRESWVTHIGVRDSNIWGLLRREWRPASS